MSTGTFVCFLERTSLKGAEEVVVVVTNPHECDWDCEWDCDWDCDYDCDHLFLWDLFEVLFQLMKLSMRLLKSTQIDSENDFQVHIAHPKWHLKFLKKVLLFVFLVLHIYFRGGK